MSDVIVTPDPSGSNTGERPDYFPRENDLIEVAIVNTLEFTAGDGEYLFQNFFYNEKMNYNGKTYSYLPFTFSGITINRAGDNVDATLAFPNNDLSRPWALKAIKNGWGVEVRVMTVDDPNVDNSGFTTLYKYFGLAAAGGWDERAITVRLNTVLDSVGGEIPTLVLDNRRVGPLPTTSNVRL